MQFSWNLLSSSSSSHTSNEQDDEDPYAWAFEDDEAKAVSSRLTSVPEIVELPNQPLLIRRNSVPESPPPPYDLNFISLQIDLNDDMSPDFPPRESSSSSYTTTSTASNGPQDAEDEENMIRAAIIASESGYGYIPEHTRHDLEEAEMIVALEESARMQRELEEARRIQGGAAAAAAANAPVTPSSPVSRNQKPESIPRRYTNEPPKLMTPIHHGETDAQQRWMAILQRQADAAAALAGSDESK